MKILRGTLVGMVGLMSAGLFVSDAWAFKIVSFNGKFTRWAKAPIHYQVDLKGSQDFNGDATRGCDKSGTCVTIQQAIEKSFDAWSRVSGAKVTFIEDEPGAIISTGNDGKNTLVWIEKNWRGQSYAPPSGALAVTISTYRTDTNEIIDSDTHFNGENFTWAVINSAQEETADVIDVQNIATHEIGHFIGLDHSSEDIFESTQKLYLATMFFASGPGEIFRRDLKEDDVSAVTNLYPMDRAAEPQITEIIPATIDVSAGKLATVQIRGKNFETSAMAMLAVAGDRGDNIAKVITASDTELTVTFDVSATASGSYDLVVANAYDSIDRFAKGITITGGTGLPDSGGSGPGSASTSSGGGCGSISGGTDNGWSGLLVLLFPLVLIGMSRLFFTLKFDDAKAALDS